MGELGKYIAKPNYVKIKLLDETSANIRKWVMEEEKDFLFAVETRGRENDEITIEESLNLAKRCVETPEIVDKLSKNNLLFLLSELRKLSKGSNINFQYRCVNDKCPDWDEFTPEVAEREGMKGRGNTLLDGIVDLGKDLTTKSFNNKPIKIGSFLFHIKDVPYLIQRKMDKEYLPELRLNQWNYDYVLASIDKIEPEPEKIISEFTREELIEFMGQLSSDEFKKLSDTIGDQMCEFKINKKVKCPICENESDVVYDEMFSLMVF